MVQSNAEWIEEAKQLLVLYLEEHQYMIAADFIADMNLEGRSVMGAVMQWAEQEGYVMLDQFVEYKPRQTRTRSSAHGKDLKRRWKSMLYTGPELEDDEYHEDDPNEWL